MEAIVEVKYKLAMVSIVLLYTMILMILIISIINIKGTGLPWPFLDYIDLPKMKISVRNIAKWSNLKVKIYGIFHYRMIFISKRITSKILRKI